MSTRFSIILDMLDGAFRSSINEKEYHDIVECLRSYSISQDPLQIQKEELAKRKWPLDYNPCDHMENIRYAFTFTINNQPNIAVQVALYKYRTFKFG